MHCILTLSHTHTHNTQHNTQHTHTTHNLCIQTIVSTYTYFNPNPELYGNMLLWIWYYKLFLSLVSLSLTHTTHTHTHTQHTSQKLALSLACIDFKIIFFFHPSTRTLHQLQLGPRNQKIAPLQLLQGFQLVQWCFPLPIYLAMHLHCKIHP